VSETIRTPTNLIITGMRNAGLLLAIASLASCDLEITCAETATCPPASIGDGGSDQRGETDGAMGDTTGGDVSVAADARESDSSIADVSSGREGSIAADGIADRTEAPLSAEAGRDADGSGGAGGRSGADASGGGDGGTGGSPGVDASGGSGGGADGSAGAGGSAGAAGTAGAGGSAGAAGRAGAAGTVGVDAGGGNGGASGSGGASGDGGASGSGGASFCEDAGGSGGTGGGAPPSCSGLAQTCGPNGDNYCCQSNLVPCGTYFRSNDMNYPATVSAFRLDTYEITVGRFRKFAAVYASSMIPSGAGKNPNNPSDTGWDVSWNDSLPLDATSLAIVLQCDAAFQTWTPSPAGNENLPINCLNWFVAQAFCIWDGGRLPTEAEWNYAASGGNEQRLYPWGSVDPGAGTTLAVYGCFLNGTGGIGSCTGIANIAPVGSVPAGAGRWGQADLAGNLFEWVQDWYADPYSTPQCNNCANTAASSYRAQRGGSFNASAGGVRSAYRSWGSPQILVNFVGARCARAR
jgi:sulfatase modifying factor 1